MCKHFGNTTDPELRFKTPILLHGGHANDPTELNLEIFKDKSGIKV